MTISLKHNFLTGQLSKVSKALTGGFFWAGVTYYCFIKMYLGLF